MKEIAIYGFGGFGREVACLINMINEVTPQWKIIGFFDDG
ncbi:MAG: serine acetyltransferase, partial [Rikenellaceae bacterium]